jgi:hypothetical protein
MATKSPYPRVNGTSRPFRLWDAKAKKHKTGCCYKYERNALNGALLAVKWGKIGDAIEVYDVETGRLLAQYVRKPTTVWFEEFVK